MNKLVTFLSLLILAALAGPAIAQSVPTPGAPQKGAIILRNASLHLGNGSLIAPGDLVFQEGKIMEVGTVSGAYPNATEVDLSGKHVYPGLIAPSTRLGIVEIELVRATHDYQESGDINPNTRSLIAYNTDSRVTPTIRSNGVLLAQVNPTGNLLAGTSSVVQLDAWNYEDAAYLADDGLHVFWPSQTILQAWWAPPAEMQKKRNKERMEKLGKAFDAAKAYHEARKAGALEAKDLRWEAMVPLFEKTKPLYVHANREKEIASALAFCQRYDVNMILIGGAECLGMATALRKHRVPVILRKTQSLPTKEDHDVDLPYRMPALLKAAGVEFCIAMDESWNVRNLPFQAGTAAAHGLDKEEALMAVTLSAAKILGIADRTGSLEKGKDANLVISAGDLLDMRTANVERAFIQGRELDLGNKQKDLYQKFRAKYKQEGSR